MRYIKDLHEGETIRNVYLCKGRRSAETRNGKPYDNLILQEIASMAQYEKVLQKCKAGDTIRIQGKRLGAGGYVEISFQLVLDSRE